MRLLFPAFIGITLLAGCAGREPAPVAITKASDNALSCLQVQTEIEANNARVLELTGEEEDKRAQNIVAGTVGLVLFAPAIFLMDFQDAAGTERLALQRRQTYLGQLANQKCNGQIAVSEVGASAATTTPAATATPAAPVTTQTAALAPAATQTGAATTVPTYATAPMVPAYPEVANSPPLFEGSSYAAFSAQQIRAYCEQDWNTRFTDAGRTEYNPCKMRHVFN